MTGPSITCPWCGRTSHHPTDVAERYCGACRRYHDDELIPVTGLASVQLQPDPVRWAVLVDTGEEHTDRLGPYTDTRLALRAAMDENRRHRAPGAVRARLAVWEE